MLSASISNPFWYKYKFTSESKDITFSSHNENTRLARIIRINLTYNFGKMDLQVKKARRGIQSDDVKSGGEVRKEKGNDRKILF